MIRFFLIALFLFPMAPSALAEPISGSDVRVIDGDTISYRSKVYRLIGYDTPETGSRAKCSAERRLANAAKQRLAELVVSYELNLTRLACSCRKGTEGTRYCNFGRRCGVLTARSQFPAMPATDVSLILINEGYAQPYQCEGTKCPPRKSWCEAS